MSSPARSTPRAPSALAVLPVPRRARPFAGVSVAAFSGRARLFTPPSTLFSARHSTLFSRQHSTLHSKLHSKLFSALHSKLHSKLFSTLLCALFCAPAFPLLPAWIPGASPSALAIEWKELPGPGSHVEITLRDGTTVVGTIASLGEAVIVLDTERFGRLELPRVEVNSLRTLTPPNSTGPAPGGAAGGAARSSTVDDRYPDGWSPDPDYNALLLVPTSETFPRGDGYYRNFELLFNNAGFAVTDDFNLSFMAAFPVTADFTIVGVGAKARVLSREEGPIGLAVAGSATFAESEHLEVLSAITTFGSRRACLSAAFNVALADDESASFVLAGGDVQFAPRAKFLLEYGNSTEGFLDDEFYGILNFGVRIFWSTTSFTLTGLRPLTGTGDGFIAFPLASFSSHF